MLIGIVLFLFLAVILYDYNVYLNKVRVQEKVVYYSLMLISLCILLLQNANVSIPSPAEAIINALRALPGIQ